MRRAIAHIRFVLRRFACTSSAAAAVEFALILPLLLTLYLGSVELSSAISVDKRVATVSGSLGDLVARADGSITSTTIDDYFLAASATMAPYPSTGVKQVVSSIFVNSSGVAKVSWSRGYNGATKHAVNSTYTLPTDLKNLALNSYVIVSEAQMSYLPLFGYFFETAFTLYHEYFFLPRFDEAIACTGC
ncbi:MAG: pilus assembly protein [Alphaproteobacteria bacterium]|nr:pilus assembly protein [Alphaproteobacteria bacterium]